MVLVTITFTDGTTAVVRCTDEEWKIAVNLAKTSVFNVMVSALFNGRIVRLNVLDVEGKRKRITTLSGVGPMKVGKP